MTLHKLRHSNSVASKVRPRIKVWLERDGQYAFGFGISRILKAVESAGSIKAAAVQLEKSYRYVWGRIKKAEKVLGEPLVKTRVGGAGVGRSSLTPVARQLVTDYDTLRQQMIDMVARQFASQKSSGSSVDSSNAQ